MYKNTSIWVVVVDTGYYINLIITRSLNCFKTGSRGPLKSEL